MTRNLLSGSMLCRQGIKLVFESNKVVLTRYGSFVGKGYDCEGMFHISIIDNSANIFYSSYSNKNIDLWHSRLCHVNNEAIVRLSKMDIIPTYNYDKNRKCEVCVCKLSNPESRFIRLRGGTPHHLS
uniref:GAG-pre-integrase domain-containing protein n=1 Tax=Arundo donax TaxID=35708 RepID=A0A0A9AG68_ARUDO